MSSTVNPALVAHLWRLERPSRLAPGSPLVGRMLELGGVVVTVLRGPRAADSQDRSVGQ